ncbi:MAG: hypothetical protein GTN97_04655 [Nitrosopumilaceae archaeon]|nr:hypothetical protein [Nitrosopumilaceae archaeon]
MVLSLGFILSFIGAAVALLIGILIFSEVSEAITCPAGNGNAECENAKNIAFTVIGILPVALFFALFAIFGSLGGGRS